MKKLDLLTGVLLVIGGLNWGLVAIAEFDLVAAIVGLEFGETNAWSRIIYGLVGLSAVYQAAHQFDDMFAAYELPAMAERRTDRSHAMTA